MRTLRRLSLTTSLVAASGLGALAGLPAVAGAASGWCSESGDTCMGTRMIDGKRYVETGFAAQYMTRATICLEAPNGTIDCRRARVRKANAGWRARMRWSAHYPNRGAGTYHFVFDRKGERVGVSFRVR